MNALYIAQAAAGQEGDPMSMLITFGLIGIIFYFLLIRPQRKQQKELKERQDSLKAGDKVVSAGGIYGIVREVQQDTVKLEIAPNTIIKIAKTSIVTTVAKDGSAEPVKK
ncbi:MAG: preprotein translocase subunit YajC [Akkermansia sp.]|jgi:preprotein translocase subunit YajC|nr:preprotein translocase subunit YajC [Akkermansia sp.]MBR5889415.1 preprotein translocase subunit YajC [Akkermansia sp.]